MTLYHNIIFYHYNYVYNLLQQKTKRKLNPAEADADMAVHVGPADAPN